MFDDIGRRRDPEAARRTAAATVIASLLVGAAGAFLVAAGAYTATKIVTSEPIDDGPIALVELDEPELVAEPPPLAPPRLGGGKTAQAGEADAPPDPGEPTEPVALKPLSKDVPVADNRVRGVEGGEGTDEETIDAPPGSGSPDGCAGCGGSGETIRAVHRNEVTLRRQILPEYPAHQDAGQACRVRVDIGEQGRPTQVRVSECDPVFASEAQRAVRKWRWARRDAGKRTVYRIVFKSP